MKAQRTRVFGALPVLILAVMSANTHGNFFASRGRLVSGTADGGYVTYAIGSHIPTAAMLPRLAGSLATFTVSSTGDLPDSDTGDGICADASGNCTFRAAIQQANASAGVDTIAFNITGSGVQTITVTSALPTITEPVIIDGYTQPGASVNTRAVGNDAVLLIEINGNNGLFSGLTVTGGSTTIRGLVINRFGGGGNGIVLRTGGGNVIEGNFIGTDASGMVEQNNGGGIFIDNSPNNTIGGSTPAARNVILGNSNNAIHTPVPVGSLPGDSAGGNIIQGNYIGSNAQGSAILGTTGVFISNPNNLVGGNAVGARNIISTQGRRAIFLDETGAHHNTIQGNYIGVTATGDAVLGSGAGGVVIERGNDNLIGGTENGERNVIVAASGGIHIFGVGGTASDNLIQGNYIGTNANGTAALPAGGSAGSGVFIDNASDNIIGGTDGGARNVIAGWNIGMRLFSGDNPVSNNLIQGNYIGTNAAGTSALPNQTGVAFTVSGGAGASAGVTNNILGGPTAEARNVISGNSGNGIRLSGANGNAIQGNFIGVAADGTTDLGNGQQAGLAGVEITTSNNNLIGGAGSGEGNVIAYSGCFCFGSNFGSGLRLLSGTGNRIADNSIHSNAELGIDLSAAGENTFRVSPNDTGDADTGPNNLQNFPVITSATSAGGSTNVKGTLNSTPNTIFVLQFFSNAACDASGHGEGQSYFGSTQATTDGSGDASIDVTFPTAISTGNVVTATATDPAGNTSEFSACRTVTSPTAAGVTIAGRVTTPAGRGIRNVQLMLTGGGLIGARPAITGPFGYYRFDDVPAGQTYILTVYSRRVAFTESSRVIYLTDELQNVNFTSAP